MSNILQRDGLTVELLTKLSYKSELGINLKKNLHYFDKQQLFDEIANATEWYDEFEESYENAKIQTEKDFKEVLKNVLSSSEKH